MIARVLDHRVRVAEQQVSALALLPNPALAVETISGYENLVRPFFDTLPPYQDECRAMFGWTFTVPGFMLVPVMYCLARST